MTLTEFLTRVKIQCPNLSGVDNAAITTLLNRGCDEVNLYMKIYKDYTDFNIIANKSIYSLAEVASNFLAVDGKAVFLKNSAGKWKDLIPKTKEWVSYRYPDYLNASSVALPQWYWLEGDELGFHPPPSTSLASGGRIYHLKKRTDMAAGGHFPFVGPGTELVALRPCDDAIIAYVKWKVSPAVGAVTDQDLRYQEFIRECQRAAKQIRRRPDMTNSPTYGLNIG